MSGLTLAPRPESRDSGPGTPRTAITACRLRCWCGSIQGILHNPDTANRAVCYCEDCQAYAHLLGRPQRVLDKRGGTEVLQSLPVNITFTGSLETLACLRLTPRGVLRWYAKCCGTPIGNTLANPKLSFIAVVHACIDTGGIPLEEIFGPVTARSHTMEARGKPKPKASGRSKMRSWAWRTMLNARLNGDYRRTPFFDPDTGEPVVKPRLLRASELVSVMAAVRMR